MNGYTQALAELSAEGLARSGALRVRINGSSMLPCLKPGDFVLVQTCEPAGLLPGEIVVARREADLVTHRLIGRDGRGLLLKGDAAPLADEPFPIEAVLGKVSAVERGGRLVSLDQPDWLAAGRRLSALSRFENRLGQAGRRITRRFFPGRQPAWLQRGSGLARRIFRWLAAKMAPRS